LAKCSFLCINGVFIVGAFRAVFYFWNCGSLSLSLCRRVVLKPGGSTLHVEEAMGLRDVVLADSVCNHSLLASSVINLTIRDNIVHGAKNGIFFWSFPYVCPEPDLAK
jgi:hypothetical protein